ncbi:MAG: hypothetical protein WCP86_03785, partial [bacterium]
MKHLFTVLTALVIVVASAFAQAGSVPIVKDILIKKVGPAAVDEGFVSAHIGTKVGQSFEADGITEDVKSLLATGQFADARVEVDNTDGKVVLTY